MKIVSALALIFGPVFASCADIIVEQKIEFPKENGSEVVKIKGDLARVDAPNAGSHVTMIVNFKTGEVVTMLREQKIFVKMTLKEVKEEARRNMAGVDNSKVGIPKATGATEKVGQFTADVYDLDAGGANMKIWAVKDFPNAQLIKDEMKKVIEAGAGGFDVSKIDVPGMVVKTHVISRAGPMTRTLVRAEVVPVADSEFSIPEDFKEVKLPTDAGPGSGK